MRNRRLEIRVVIVGLERYRVDLDYAFQELFQELNGNERFNLNEYKQRFTDYINGGIDDDVERIVIDYSYVFIAYSNLNNLIRNRRFNK